MALQTFVVYEIPQPQKLYTSEELFRAMGLTRPGQIITDRCAQTIASWWLDGRNTYTMMLATGGKLDRYATLADFGDPEQWETADNKAALLALGRWIDARKAGAESGSRPCACTTCMDTVVGIIGDVCHACTEWGCDPTEDNNECNVIPDDASTEEECPAWETGRLSPESANHANRAASFHPVSDPGTYPALEVAGVLVFAYFDESGTLRVSVHLDDAEDGATDALGCVPIRVDVGGTAVFSA